ncbi:hypothetical protein [Variovorax gossypii]
MNTFERQGGFAHVDASDNVDLDEQERFNQSSIVSACTSTVTLKFTNPSRVDVDNGIAALAPGFCSSVASGMASRYDDFRGHCIGTR